MGVRVGSQSSLVITARLSRVLRHLMCRSVRGLSRAAQALVLVSMYVCIYLSIYLGTSLACLGSLAWCWCWLVLEKWGAFSASCVTRGRG